MNISELDSRINILGREIFERIRAESRLSVGAMFDDGLMSLSMRDESLKAQLFRFVDVLPALRSSRQIMSHLREYLGEGGRNLPAVLQATIRNLPTAGLFGPAIASFASFNTKRMARRFIAATDLDEAVESVIDLRRRRLAFTLDVLGEAIVSETEAAEYQQKYIELIEGLSRRLAAEPFDQLIDAVPRVNVSIKLSALYSQFDPLDLDGTTRTVRERLLPILRAARNSGVFVNFDMEQFSFKDATLHIFKSIFGEGEFRDWPDIGIAMQAYLKSTHEDLRGLVEWAKVRETPVWVRLVKGAYWDYETVISAQNNWPNPVFTNKAETDANFETCSAYLIENHRVLRPAIASHNVRSIAAAMALAEKFEADVEFQMLYGMAEPIKAALAAMGRRVRVYAPMGKLLPGMAYLVRRLLENTSNESFLRAGFLEHVPQEELLMNPVLKTSKQKQVQKPEFMNEPPLDFSIARNRLEMESCVMRFEPGREYPMVIGGGKVVSGNWIDSINPSHKSQIIGRCAAATVQHAESAIAAAKAALPGWRNTPAEDRSALLDRVADSMSRKRVELAAIEVHECAKPWREADSDITEAIDFCRYYAWQMRLLSESQGANIPGETNRWIYEPRGVAVVIAPWNFPLAILCGMTAAAVVAGNPAVMKPAEQSPIIASMLMEAFEEAGAPPGVVNYLPGVGEEIGPTLVNHPDVALIAFTGSRAVGLGINQSASQAPAGQDHVKRIILEMGGKNAIIVDEDADMDEAVTGVVASAFGYSGQKCSACSRVVVLESIYETFPARLVEATRSLKIAPAEDPSCKIGPVIDAEAYQRIVSEIERGKYDARLAFAGDVGNLSNEGFYIAPHIFADVQPSSRLAQEEIFGPVLSVMKARDLAHAIEIANGVKYALTGGVYSRSPANIDRCRREIRVGNLYINRKITGALVGRQPFGGFNLSGSGTQAGGPDYLRHFMLPRCITENTLRHGFAPEDE